MRLEKYIDHGFYKVSDAEAARLARGVRATLPKAGYQLRLEHGWLMRTPYKHYTDAPERGWVWAVMVDDDWITEASKAARGARASYRNPSHRRRNPSGDLETLQSLIDLRRSADWKHAEARMDRGLRHTARDDELLELHGRLVKSLSRPTRDLLTVSGVEFDDALRFAVAHFRYARRHNPSSRRWPATLVIKQRRGNAPLRVRGTYDENERNGTLNFYVNGKPYAHQHTSGDWALTEIPLGARTNLVDAYLTERH